MSDGEDRLREIETAGQYATDNDIEIEKRRSDLADAVVKQNKRMDSIESRASVSRMDRSDLAEERTDLADAVVAQNERMDGIESRARISRSSYQEIIDAALRVQDNSNQLRDDVDNLLIRVKKLEEYVQD